MSNDTTIQGERTVLLNGSVRGVLPFVSRDGTRPVLQGVRVTPDYVEATDSYKLCRITLNSPTAQDYPHLPGGESAVAEIPEGGVVVEGRTLGKALRSLPNKSALPILSHVAVKPVGELVQLSSTDLGETSVLYSKRVSGISPDIDELLSRVRTNEPKATVSVDVKHLRALIKGADDFGADVVTIEVREPLSPVVVLAEDSGQTFTALLMPVRKV